MMILPLLTTTLALSIAEIPLYPAIKAAHKIGLLPIAEAQFHMRTRAGNFFKENLSPQISEALAFLKKQDDIAITQFIEKVTKQYRARPGIFSNTSPNTQKLHDILMDKDPRPYSFISQASNGQDDKLSVNAFKLKAIDEYLQSNAGNQGKRMHKILVNALLDVYKENNFHVKQVKLPVVPSDSIDMIKAAREDDNSANFGLSLTANAA